MKNKIQLFLDKMRGDGKSTIVLVAGNKQEEVFSDCYLDDAIRLNITLSRTVIQMLQREYKITFNEASELFLTGLSRSLKEEKEFSELSA